jgi:hypothetical protein
MTGLIGALVAFAVVLAIVLVLAVRPAARRFTRVAAAVRDDLTVQVDRLRALRHARRARAVVVESPSAEVPVLAAPSGAAASPSPIGGHGRHRRVDGAP